jgi:hypothetical protein
LNGKKCENLYFKNIFLLVVFFFTIKHQKKIM